MQIAGSSIFDELDDALSSGTSEQCINMLRRVADLFLIDAHHLNDEQIGIFDDVFCCLVDRVEFRPLAQIGKLLLPIDRTPLNVTLRLARHEQISVAGRVLKDSKRLTNEHLVDIAKAYGQQHLLAISHRAEVASEITDVLLDRGNRAVIHRVASNAGAQISETGFRTLMKTAETDDVLAGKISFRLDRHLQSLLELLLRATEASRSSPHLLGTI